MALVHFLGDKHAVMATLDFFQTVSHGGEEVVIGSEDVAIKAKCDDRLILAECSQLTARVEIQAFLGREIDCKLDDLVGVAV